GYLVEAWLNRRTALPGRLQMETARMGRPAGSSFSNIPLRICETDRRATHFGADIEETAATFGVQHAERIGLGGESRPNRCCGSGSVRGRRERRRSHKQLREKLSDRPVHGSRLLDDERPRQRSDSPRAPLLLPGFRFDEFL